MGNFLADFYSVNGLVLESRKRREHLSEEDILRNKAIMESLSKGGNLIEQNFEVSITDMNKDLCLCLITSQTKKTKTVFLWLCLFYVQLKSCFEALTLAL